MLTVDDKNFNWRDISLAECIQGNALDTFYTARIFGILYEALKEKGLIKLYEDLIVPATDIFLEMELEGMLVSEEELDKFDADISKSLEKSLDEFKSLSRIPKEANLRSNAVLIKTVYSLEKNKETDEWDINPDVGYGLYPFEMTAKGQPSTNDETMTQLASMVEEEYVRRGLSDGKA